MTARRKLLLIAALCVACCAALRGQALPDPMSPPRLVNDFAGVMSAAQQAALEAKLVAFDRETSTQIAVVTVDSLRGYDASDFAQRLHEKWGVGGAGKDNGLLVLVKPKTDDSRGQAFISVGYGLEGVIPDITAGRIVEQEMLPAFRENDYYTGIDRATDRLMQLASGEFSAADYSGDEDGFPPGMVVGIIFWTILIILLLLASHSGHGSGGGSGGSNGGGFPPIFMGGGGSFGGGFGGGSGGGGFGGFGGGTSGGGGGGRSW